uniref:FERM domain-containing protein n=1 Tax=Romanomermis culicivorax TaxID=13658 RepID=A0A915KJP1_ROMCU
MKLYSCSSRPGNSSMIGISNIINNSNGRLFRNGMQMRRSLGKKANRTTKIFLNNPVMAHKKGTMSEEHKKSKNGTKHAICKEKIHGKEEKLQIKGNIRYAMYLCRVTLRHLRRFAYILFNLQRKNRNMPEEADKSPATSPKHVRKGHDHLRQCTVQLLDDVAIQVEFKKTDVGSDIFGQVCDHLNLVERDYFGLRFMDHNLHRYWLDPAKPIIKQVKAGSEPIVFAFRVKFYPADPTILKEDFTRYLLVLQLRRDLLHGRLHSPQTELACLAAYVIQAELGDYDPNEHQGNYVSQFKILINQSPRIEEKIAQFHKTLACVLIILSENFGQKSSEVDLNFLKKASSLDTYGYYPYTIKSLRSMKKSRNLLNWLIEPEIDSMDYTGKEFYIFPQKSYFEKSQIEDIFDTQANSGSNNISLNGSLQRNGHGGNSRPPSSDLSSNGTATTLHLNVPVMLKVRNVLLTEQVLPVKILHHRAEVESKTAPRFKKESKKKPCLKFFCPSSTFSKQMWKYMLSQKAFFTSTKSDQIKPVVKRHFLFGHSTFRWYPNSRVLEELKEADFPKRTCPEFKRLKIPQQAGRDERSGPWTNKFHTMPSRNRNPVSDSQLNSHSLAQPTTATSAEAPELSSTGVVPHQRPTILRPVELGFSPSNNLAQSSMNNGSVVSPDASLPLTTVDAATPIVSPIVTSSFLRPSMSETKESPLRESAASMPHTSTPKRALNDETDGRKLTGGSKNGVVKSVLTYENNTKIQETDADRPEAISSQIAAGGDHPYRCLLRFLFLVLLVVILLTALVIFALETDDQSVRRRLDQWPLVDDFRHKFYEPWRRQIPRNYSSSKEPKARGQVLADGKQKEDHSRDPSEVANYFTFDCQEWPLIYRMVNDAMAEIYNSNFKCKRLNQNGLKPEAPGDGQVQPVILCRHPQHWNYGSSKEPKAQAQFDEERWHPIPNAVLLGDSGYPIKQWLIPLLFRPIMDAELKFNIMHKKMRRIIENSLGILKKPFACLASVDFLILGHIASQTWSHGFSISDDTPMRIPKS